MLFIIIRTYLKKTQSPEKIIVRNDISLYNNFPLIDLEDE